MIVKNRIRCNHCGEIIESRTVHDFVRCACGTCGVDGGKEYLRRIYKNDRSDYTEMSETE